MKTAQSDSSQNEMKEEVRHWSIILNDATECWFCHFVQLRWAINSFTAQIMTDLSNDIDEKDLYLQSSNSLNSENENKNTMNESDKKVSLNIKSVKNCSWLITWYMKFYSFSFLWNMNFMILKSWCHSSLQQQDLLYCQFYNMSKKIFITENHELFVNMNLNELMLNLSLLHTWQHIERELSQSLLILLKYYIYKK